MTRSSPKQIGSSVRELRDRFEPATPLAAVQSSWADAVGELVARNARPVRERDGTITVECRSSTWAQELDLLQLEVVERLNRELGGGTVERLRTVVGTSDDFDSQ